jgi:hypothetical protein
LLNNFIFASEFLQDAKQMRMMEANGNSSKKIKETNSYEKLDRFVFVGFVLSGSVAAQTKMKRLIKRIPIFPLSISCCPTVPGSPKTSYQ